MHLNLAAASRDLKDKVYELHHLDETGRRKLSRGGVASTLNAIAAEVESSSKGKAFFDSDSRKQHVAAINMGASPLRRQVSTMGVIKIKPRRRLPVEEVRGITSRVKMVKNARRFQSLRRHLSYKVGIVPASAVEEDDEKAMSVMRVPAHDKAAAAEVAKKIRRVEHVLSAQTILYESDVEDDKRAAKEQAIARMQELAGYGNVLSRRTTRETPRVKLQRLLRKALRQYKRDKARGLVNKRTHEVTGHGGDLQRLDHHRFTVQEYRQRITSGVTNFAHAHGPHMFGGAQALDEAPRRHSFSVMPSDEQADTFFQQAKGAPSHRKTDFDGHVHPASEKASGQPHHQPHHQDRPSSRWQASVRTVAFGLHAITSMHRHKVHLTRHELEKIKRRVDRNRRWSCSALEGLVCTQLQLQGSSGDAGNSSMMSAVARSWGSSAEDGQKAALRLRRQSFPSLENEVWRDAHTYEAVL